MERFDVAVVGAGPAGSTAAYRLARAGARVLLLDKARFPRDKPCGGGLTQRAVRELPFSVEPVVEHVVERMSFRFRYGTSFERGSGGPLVLMTQRRRLDHFLAEQAAAAGVDFRDGVKAVVEDERTVRVGDDRVQAEVLIAADGANGTTARALGLGGGHVNCVALEGNLPYDGDGDRFKGKAVFELGTIAGGYTWVFPKGDHANFGVWGWASQAPRLRTLLSELCTAHDVDHERMTDVKGHRLPIRIRPAAVTGGRALLVGDAAGLVEPLSGEGLYGAVLSSRLAAEAVLEFLASRRPLAESYATALDASLVAPSRAFWTVKMAFDRRPGAAFTLARVPVLWSFTERLVTGEIAQPVEGGAAVRLAYRLTRWCI